MSSDALQYAILSLDSYNQGYDPFVDHGKIVIGSMTKILESDIFANSDEVAASFYAAAYQDASGNIVISYRGTDDPLGGDLAAWTRGAGFETVQASMAAQHA